METRYVREFIKLAERGSYIEAAEDLYISQSSLSKHIQKLEKDLGCTLFSRSTRKVELSPAGEAFLPAAKEIIRQEDGFLRHLVIGTVPVLAEYRIVQLFSSFRKFWPDIPVEPVTAESDRLREMVREHLCDAAFICEGEDSGNDFSKVCYCRDRLVCMVSSAGYFEKGIPVPLSSLSGEKFLLPGKESAITRIALDACRKSGFEPQIAYTDARTGNLAAMAGQGEGILLVSGRTAAYNRNDCVQVLELTPETPVCIDLCYPSAKEPSAPLSEFIRFVTSHTLQS